MNSISTKNRFEKINFYALLLLAFSLNLQHVVLEYTLALWIFTTFFCLDFKLRYSIRKRYFVPMILLLVLILGRTVVSIIHGDVISLGKKLMDTQLSLLLLPILLLYYRQPYFNIRKVLKTYILGCVISSLMAIGLFYLYRFHFLEETRLEKVFPPGAYSGGFGMDIRLFNDFITPYFKHRACMGLFLSLAVASLIYLVKQAKNMSLVRKYQALLIGVFLSLVLYATGSRSGLISLVLVLVFGLVYLFSKRKIVLISSFFAVLIFFIGLSTLKTTRPLLFSEISSRNYTEIRKADSRFPIWECCGELIEKHPFIGIGYSNIRNELSLKYNEKGMVAESKEHFNSHNQLLQFSLESGIWAGVLFLVILLPVYFRKNILYISVCFSACMLVLSLFEDSMQMINGVAAFVFFMTVLTLTQRKMLKLHR